VPAAIRAAKSRAAPVSGKDRTRTTSGTGGFTLALTATRSDGGNPLHPEPGQSVTMTATTNIDVGPTPYYIDIYDTTTAQLVTWCDSGTSCSLTVTENSPVAPGSVGWVAFIADLAPTLTPPDVQAESDPFQPCWLYPLQVTTYTYDPWDMSTTTVTGGAPISAPWYVELWDLTTDQLVAACSWGSSCLTPGQVYWSSYNPAFTGCTCAIVDLANATDTYWVVIAKFAETWPPPDIRDWSDHYF